MTEKKQTQQKHMSKPKVASLKIVRNCLSCGNTFVAATKYIRLCGCVASKG